MMHAFIFFNINLNFVWVPQLRKLACEELQTSLKSLMTGGLAS